MLWLLPAIMNRPIVSIMWFRRDLRLFDQAALYHSLRSTHPVLPLFIFDTSILDLLEDKDDRRVQFIHMQLQQMNEQLQAQGSGFLVKHGKPIEIWKQILQEFEVKAVFANHDYEPYALERDTAIQSFLRSHNIPFQTYKDQVIFEKNEVLKDDGTPYTVFTPYSKRWKATLKEFFLRPYPVEKYHHNFFKHDPRPMISLPEMGFSPIDVTFPETQWSASVIKAYSAQRDFPGISGTSRLGVHLRFGTISIRELARTAGSLNETFLNELIWREFYHMILWHFPRVGKNQCFKPEYEQIKWRNNEEEFEKWCNGQTGYPIVDAGMRELNATGYMHNRVRMVVASFLTKHLLIDWRWGEAYFAKKLLDFDLAANNGGWQWAAGCGCDAAPYFRVFNPYLQTKKFDPDFSYIRKWVPEFEGFSYPAPIVEHEFARNRCLEAYGSVLKKSLN